jgi:uncharacterized protein
MRRFWIILYTFTVLSHVPFALGARYALEQAGAPGAAWLALLTGATLVALLRGVVRRGMVDAPVHAWKRWLFYEPYYVHWCAALMASFLFLPALALSFAGGLLREGFAGASAAAQGAAGGQLAPIGALAAGSYAIALALCGFGVFVRRRWLRVRTLDVPVAGLSPAFDGYRIAQLSDIHIGSLLSRRRAERWVDQTNALDVDLVALTGDYVTSGEAFHGDIAEVLGRLRARDRVVAVMGNHDYFGDGEALVTALRAGGVTVLRNERLELERGGERLTLAGVDDTWTRRADVDRTLSGRDPASPAVVLAHDPALFPALAELGASVVLSGHTHWGQLGAPFLSARYNMARLAHRYHADVYREGRATLYVHPGMGTTGPPIRLGVAPEVTVLRLRRAD